MNVSVERGEEEGLTAHSGLKSGKKVKFREAALFASREKLNVG